MVWISRSSTGEEHSVSNVISAILLVASRVRESGETSEAREEARRLLRKYRLLLVLDDFYGDDELIDWVSRVPEPSRVLITTRRLDPGKLTSAAVVHLGGLDLQDARNFLSSHASDVVDREPEAIEALVEVTGGNPQALLLATGLAREKILLSDVVKQLRTERPARQLDMPFFQKLFSSSWKELDGEAQQIIMATSLFSSLPSIRQDALAKASDMDQPVFDAALRQLTNSNLLDVGENGRIFVHPLVRALARNELDRALRNNPGLEKHMRSKELEYYLGFIRHHVVRKRPLELPRYWNSIVSGSMANLDPEWPAINEIIQWAIKNDCSEDVVEFVMLAVHYMDSRFLNEERIEYVKYAIERLSKSGRKGDEALLRIDALGWTFIEKDALDEAKKTITAGFRLARDLENADLTALAYSWLARIETEAGEAGNVITATGLVERALGMKTSPWIWYRVNMAAGDIAYSEEQYERALQFYQTGANKVEEYGGEEGYQIETRLGLAWVGLERLDEAERIFTRLIDKGQIAIGQMHAKYGLALVAKKRGHPERAKQLASDVRQALTTRTKSSLLLKMINDILQPEVELER